MLYGVHDVAGFFDGGQATNIFDELCAQGLAVGALAQCLSSAGLAALERVGLLRRSCTARELLGAVLRAGLPIADGSCPPAEVQRAPTMAGEMVQLCTLGRLASDPSLGVQGAISPLADVAHGVDVTLELDGKTGTFNVSWGGRFVLPPASNAERWSMLSRQSCGAEPGPRACLVFVEWLSQGLFTSLS